MPGSKPVKQPKAPKVKVPKVKPAKVPKAAAKPKVKMAAPAGEKSKGSMISITGNKAEELLCSQASVATALAVYFGKPIAAIEKIPSKPHPKKSDLLVKFADGTTATVQNKNGDGGGRGYSVDRRDAHLVAPNCPELTETLRTVCLHQAGERRDIAKAVGLEVISRCILGTEEATKPAYFLHSTLTDGRITGLAMATAAEFIAKVSSDVYDLAQSKKTCVHLSPHIYLQRKGGGKTDKHPDHIQMKFRFTPAIASIFKPISLTL
jgi:hypothetical protein